MLTTSLFPGGGNPPGTLEFGDFSTLIYSVSDWAIL
jgi:hypothetical protein